MAAKYTLLASSGSAAALREERSRTSALLIRWSMWTFLALSIALNIFLVAFGLFLPTASDSGHSAEFVSNSITPPLAAASSWNNIWGEVPFASVTWRSYTPYSDGSEKATKLWNALSSPSGGLLSIPKPRLAGLPPSFVVENDTRNSEIYMTSGVHQLHCLTMLYEFVARHDPTSSTSLKRRKFNSHAPVPHLYHCLDYVRQAVMCVGDTTLEPVEYVLGENGLGDGFEIDSSATPRTCRDWDVMSRVVDKFGITLKST